MRTKNENTNLIELLTHEEIPTQCGMATQEWMATQYDQASVPAPSTPSIESSKVKNPNPMPHPTQHHLALLHASSRGNDRIGSLDLLDSGGRVPRSLQVYNLWYTGGQRSAHPWDHNDGPRGHFHKSCNQECGM